MPTDLQSYKQLIEDYLLGRITVQEFGDRYFDKFRDEPGGLSEEEYDILETLWTDIEVFVEDPNYRGKGPMAHLDIDEIELRRRTEIALKKLNEMIEDEQKYKEKVARQQKELTDMLIKWNQLNSVPDAERKEKYDEFVRLILFMFHDNNNKKVIIKYIKGRLKDYMPNRPVPSDIGKFVDELLIWKEKNKNQ